MVRILGLLLVGAVLSAGACGENVGALKATVELQQDTIEAQATQIAELQATVEAQRRRIAALEGTAPQPTPRATPGPGGMVVHRVQPGETLGAIAERYGTTVEAIVRANGLTNPNFISVGQDLQIPR